MKHKPKPSEIRLAAARVAAMDAELRNLQSVYCSLAMLKLDIHDRMKLLERQIEAERESVRCSGC